MDLTVIDPIWWVVLGVVVVLLVGLLVWSGRRRSDRTERLRGQFKSEYDRTAASASKKEAEEDLESRAARRSMVDLAELEESDVDSLERHVDELLRSFADGPQGAALGMTQLVGRVAVARGYVATEGSVLDLVSVDHPEQVAAMRRSEAEMHKAQKGANLTEASRQTFLNARALAERLLAEGRAGHLDDDDTEPPRPAPPQPQSDVTTDVPAPPLAQEEAPVAEPNRETGSSSTSGSPATSGPQMGTTAGRVPPG